MCVPSSRSRFESLLGNARKSKVTTDFSPSFIRRVFPSNEDAHFKASGLGTPGATRESEGPQPGWSQGHRSGAGRSHGPARLPAPSQSGWRVAGEAADFTRA